MIEYRVSSFCNLGNCVAVGLAPDGRVAVADTKTDQDPLLFTTDEWTAFCDGVRRGEFEDLGRGSGAQVGVVPEP